MSVTALLLLLLSLWRAPRPWHGTRMRNLGKIPMRSREGLAPLSPSGRDTMHRSAAPFENCEDADAADKVVLAGQEGFLVLPPVDADRASPVGIAVGGEAEDLGVLNGVGSHFCVMWVVCGVAV